MDKVLELVFKGSQGKNTTLNVKNPKADVTKAEADTAMQRRNPLCFSLKYILAKVAGLDEYITPINEIIGAYIFSGFNIGFL